MQRLSHANQERVFFNWNGSRVEGRKGDTVAAALYALGIRAIARSRKKHRPLGLSGSYVLGVLAHVNGRPNVRLDLEPVSDGLEVEGQNAWPGPGRDLLAALQMLPDRWVRGGFEHSSLVPSGTRRFQLWERFLAYLAGMASAPDANLPSTIRPGRRIAFDALVVGGGPAGRRAANDLANSGSRIALASRRAAPGRYARALGGEMPELDPRVELFAGIEIFGLYRGGRLVAGASSRHDEGAVVFDTKQVVLATGRRSIPPLVAGSHLPGVLDAHAAMALAFDCGVAPGRAVVVVGTGAQALVARRLRELGVNVILERPVAGLRRIEGRAGVESVMFETTVACDTLVHAGPWRSDPGLIFQARAEGLTQLRLDGTADAVVGVVEPDASEPISVARSGIDAALVCPCMDVPAAEITALIDQGETDPELLKRLTACGMGPCQGMPCWESLSALLAAKTGGDAAAIARPSHRPPRRALTVAQAAGLCDLVEPDR